MPTVGSGKKKRMFPYTAAGEKQAQMFGKQTGQKVVKKKPVPKRKRLMPAGGGY